jgi:hypothetical protein
MKSWYLDVLIGWVSVIGVLLINIAFIGFDPNTSPYTESNDFCFNIEAIGNFFCSGSLCYFISVGRVPLIGKIGATLFASGYAMNLVKELIGLNVDASFIQILFYLATTILVLYVANSRRE